MRWFQLLLAVCCLAAAIAACGGTSSTSHRDAGGTTTATTGGSGGTTAGGCGDSSACTSGEFCISGHCGTCDGFRPPVLACPIGQVCNHTSHDCEAINGSSSGSTGTTGGTTTGTTGATACTHRSDCTGAEACTTTADGGFCSSPAADAGCDVNDQCTKAYICQAHECVFGCYNNLDCHGTQQPACIPGNPGHCGACTSNSQCLANENCQAGQCVAKASCTSADTCGGLGCVSGFCAPCTGASDCSSGNQCDTNSGHCVAGPAGCTTDAQCQSAHSGSPAWYCDVAHADGGPAQCQLGCVPDSACSPPQIGCCNLGAGQTCDSTAHQCIQGATTSGTTSGTGSTTSSTTSGTGSTTSGCDTASCDSQCASINLTCDYTQCACSGTGTTTGSTTSGGTGGGGSCSPSGDIGEPCGPNCECNSGYSCMDFGGTTYDPGNSSDVQTCQAAQQYCSFGFPILICD